MGKRAVILFNLGGPDKPSANQPFLFNLFNDAAIINLPNPFRWLEAKIVSKKRTPIAEKIYGEIGGRSPLLELTHKQAEVLEYCLNEDENINSKVFISMRYWHPMSLSVTRRVKEFDPDEIILLPLYPHFSTTTTGSSIKDWKANAKKAKLNKNSKIVCCYPTNENLIKAQADLLIKEIKKTTQKTRILFSAHGLPKKVIQKGDPYKQQIEKTAAAIASAAKIDFADWCVCYQSRVGPLQWIGPSLDDEIVKAADDNIGVIILPISFVSEHSETLVELDIEYKKIADKLNLPYYSRVPAMGTHPDFISCLSQLVKHASEKKTLLTPGLGEESCSLDKRCCMQIELLSK